MVEGEGSAVDGPTIEEKYLMTFSALIALISRTPNRRVFITNTDLVAAGACQLHSRPYADGIIIESVPSSEAQAPALVVSPTGND